MRTILLIAAVVFTPLVHADDHMLPGDIHILSDDGEKLSCLP